MDLAVDQASDTLYVAARADPAVLVVNGETGQRLATIPLPVDPGEVRLDADLGLLYVVLPERQEIALVDVRSGQVRQYATGLPQVTGLALDAGSHTLFVAHLTGQVSVLDGQSGQVLSRVRLTGAGLSGLATARGLVSAINPATRELVVVDPGTLAVNRFPLPDEPGSLVAGEGSGTVYVLASTLNALLRIDPTDGAEVGRVLLPDRSGRFGVRLPRRDFQGLRSRMAIRQADETVYVSQPEAGLLSIVAPDRFPPLAREIPRPEGALAAAAAPGAPTPPQPPAPMPVAPRPAPAPAPTAASDLLALRPRTPGRGSSELVAGLRPLAAALPALDWAIPRGRFYTQANGQPARAAATGFAITDDTGISFWSTFERLGGPDLLGYPTSSRFQWRGRVVQLTQRVLLQWWPETTSATLANLLDDLHDAGQDEWLLRERGIPRQETFAEEAGLSFEAVKRRRLALLDADPAIRARYFGGETPDPVQVFGLPTSRVVDLGPLVALRTQRGVLQRWKIDTAWARAGEVTVALTGDLARDRGLFGAPAAPFTPVEPGPGDASAERLAPTGPGG